MGHGRGWSFAFLCWFPHVLRPHCPTCNDHTHRARCDQEDVGEIGVVSSEASPWLLVFGTEHWRLQLHAYTLRAGGRVCMDSQFPQTSPSVYSVRICASMELDVTVSSNVY